MEKSNIVFLRRIEDARAKRKTIHKQEEEQKKELNTDLLDYFAESAQT